MQDPKVSEKVLGIEKVTKGRRLERIVVSNWDLLDGFKELVIQLSNVREENSSSVEEKPCLVSNSFTPGVTEETCRFKDVVSGD